MQALTGGALAGRYGIDVTTDDPQLGDDPTGDSLDALLCGVQAGGAGVTGRGSSPGHGSIRRKVGLPTRRRSERRTPTGATPARMPARTSGARQAPAIVTRMGRDRVRARFAAGEWSAGRRRRYVEINISGARTPARGQRPRPHRRRAVQSLARCRQSGIRPRSGWRFASGCLAVELAVLPNILCRVVCDPPVFGEVRQVHVVPPLEGRKRRLVLRCRGWCAAAAVRSANISIKTTSCACCTRTYTTIVKVLAPPIRVTFGGSRGNGVIHTGDLLGGRAPRAPRRLNATTWPAECMAIRPPVEAVEAPPIRKRFACHAHRGGFAPPPGHKDRP